MYQRQMRTVHTLGQALNPKSSPYHHRLFLPNIIRPAHFHTTPISSGRRTKMSWMDSWSRPSKHQATPAPYYLVPGGEATPYCHSCGRVISSRRTGASATTAATSGDKGSGVKYCSSRCRGHKPGKLDREIESVFVGFMSGSIERPPEQGAKGESGSARGMKKSARAGGEKKVKGDTRILVSCDEVERHLFGRDSSDEPASGTEAGHADDTSGSRDPEEPPPPPPPLQVTTTMPASHHSVSSGTLEDPASHRDPPIDYDVLARLSVRSGTRIRPPQSVSEVNGSVGGEKGRAERVEETDEMLEKRREGLRKARQREMVRCAARRGVVFGFTVGKDKGDEGQDTRKKCEAVMLGKVVEPSFAKGDWSVRWRE